MLLLIEQVRTNVNAVDGEASVGKAPGGVDACDCVGALDYKQGMAEKGMICVVCLHECVLLGQGALEQATYERRHVIKHCMQEEIKMCTQDYFFSFARIAQIVAVYVPQTPSKTPWHHPSRRRCHLA